MSSDQKGTISTGFHFMTAMSLTLWL